MNEFDRFFVRWNRQQKLLWRGRREGVVLGLLLAAVLFYLGEPIITGQWHLL